MTVCRPPRILAALVGLSMALCGCGPPAGPPSILLVTLDTTRADHLGAYGHPEPLTPHLDALARGGTVFTRAMAQASVTPVSHASLFTGLNPYEHGLRILDGVVENRLEEKYITLAEVLGHLGYATSAFVSAFPASERFGLAQGFDAFDADFLVDPLEKIVSPTGQVATGRNQRRADRTTDLALEWLAGAPERFFCWIHYFDPHDVLVLPPGDAMAGVDPGRGGKSPEEWVREVLGELYRREVAFMDAQIGRLLDELERAGRLDETIVLVVADHGQGLGDHGWWSHGLLYQEQVRVPMILRLPPSDPRAGPRRVEYVVRTIDVMPTLLELIGLDPSQHPPMSGSSLVPLLEDPEAPDPGYVAYADALAMATMISHPELPPEVKDDMLFLVTDGSWSYIHHLLRPEESELYDLTNDPGEEKNLFHERPDEARRFQRALAAHPFTPRAGQEEEMSAEDRERLRSLGYVR